LHAVYPEYGFNRHRGYPTAQHRQILMQLGPTAEHRFSFRPVREAARRLESLKTAANGVRT
jgi:ribonuclease HII